jgi:lysylphosphatidylglycerol synthetase-like protein (DUF2156 family)
MPEISHKDTRRIAAAISAVAGLVTVGTVSIHYLERWPWIDCFYFVSMTVSTVGHGELYPTNDATKIVSSLLAFAGVMIVVYSMSVVGSIFFRQAEKGNVARKIASGIEKGRKAGRGRMAFTMPESPLARKGKGWF